MSIQETWLSTLRQHGRGFDANWEPLPGDAVCDTHDPKGTYGIIVAITTDRDSDAPPKALVLWTRDLQLSDHDQLVKRMAEQICVEVDADIINELVNEETLHRAGIK
jgi:hypothetical protein